MSMSSFRWAIALRCIRRGINTLACIALLAMSFFLASASDPSPLQDFCVAVNDTKTTARPNAFMALQCLLMEKSARIQRLRQQMISSFQGFGFLDIPQTNLGQWSHPANVAQIPGLNTLGISLARVDYAPYGFVTSNPDNRLIAKVLYKGDVFVFPEGLIHFHLNVGKTKAVAIAALSSQNPGVITIANAVFGSKPAISADVLTKAFQVDKKVVDYLQSQF
ncbi:Germin-like protein 8-2 [Vitis vinifera]|uniref:Germin-like protein n=1 Tax=Vitis vinifera TaxID=29760 RepID=A0A438C6J4_VITVI|nr:Germin-like protein 8-2 [Vitis vinifera]